MDDMIKYSPGLNYTELNQRFPNAMIALKQWFLQRPDIVEILDKQSQPKDRERIIYGYVDTMVGFNARGLYEFFDEQKIKIYITDHQDYENVFFYYNSELRNSKTANSRIEAEEGAFIDAFDLLEKRS